MKQIIHTIRFIGRYLCYRITAKNEHSIHSPFIFDLYTNCLKHKETPNQYFKNIETLRLSLLKNHTILDVVDLGAGSKATLSNKRSISQIAKHSLKSKHISFLLYRLAKYLSPKDILELGTSLGITTLYLAKSGAKITTVEGSESIHILAKSIIHKTMPNVNVVHDNFDHFLPSYLSLKKCVNFIFIDGNHTYKATISYFKMCLPFINYSSVLIFDDIYWSKEMKKAWREITNHPKVQVSIDLFHIGIVLFDPSITKKNYVLTL